MEPITPTPTGSTFEEDKFRREAERRLSRSRTSFSPWRSQCQRWFSTYAGDPWEPGDRQDMEQSGRPVVTFNYALSTVNAVVGSDMADRKEAQYQGAEGDIYDETLAEWYTKLLRHVYQRNGCHRQESTAQLDQLVTGYGWTEAFIDSSRFPFRVNMRHVDCGRMHVDPDYKQDGCADARYVFCEASWDRDDVIARWPDKAHDIEGLSSDYQSVFPKVAASNNYRTPESGATTEPPEEPGTHVRVYDYQFRRKEQWIAFDDPEKQGAWKEVPKAEFAKIQKELFAQVDPTTGMPLYGELNSTAYARDVFYRAYLCAGSADGLMVLEEPKRIEEDSFTYKCATGFREKDFISDRTRHFGLMALIYEPQMWSAKTLSTIIEMLSRSAKGGGFFKKGMFENPQAFLNSQAKPGMWFAVEDSVDFGSDLFERNAMSWPQGMDRLLDVAVNGIPQLTSVTDAVKGTLKQERSNVLITNLQTQSMTVLNPILDPMSSLRIENAILIGKLIQRYMSARDINRLLGNAQVDGVNADQQDDPENPGQKVMVPRMVPDESSPEGQRPMTPADVIRDQAVFEFDIVVDLGAASTTAKQAIWQLFNQTGLLSKLMEVGFPMQELFPFLIRNTPGIPAEQSKQLADKLKKQMEQQEMMQTVQGIMEALKGLPPDQVSQIAGAAQQQLGGAPPEGGAPPPEEGAPPEGAAPPEQPAA